MAQEAKKTPLEIAKDSYEKALKAANDALGKNPVDLVAYNAAMGDLDKWVIHVRHEEACPLDAWLT